MHNSSHRGPREGCWTGWVADMNLMKSLTTRRTPDTYLESYPRSRAGSLNTWLSRFGIYSNGLFLELDRRGSALVKDLLMRSPNATGCFITIIGMRKGNVLAVQTAYETPRRAAAKFNPLAL